MLLKSAKTLVVLAVVIPCLILIALSVDAQEAVPGCSYDSLSPSLESAWESYGALDFYCAAREIRDVVAIDTIALEQIADGYRLLSLVLYDSLVFADPADIESAVIETGKLAWKADPYWSGEYEIDEADYVDWMNEARQLALAEIEQERLREEAEQNRLDSLARVEQVRLLALAAIEQERLQEEAEQNRLDSLARVEQVRQDRIALAEKTRTDSIALANLQPPDSLVQDAFNRIVPIGPKKKPRRWYQKRWVQATGVALVAGAAVAIFGGGSGDDGGGGGGGGGDLPDFPDPPGGK